MVAAPHWLLDRNKWNWYCGHFSDVYFIMPAKGVLSCVSPSGILERSDVRLIVDVSGGTAAFAAGVQALSGDRLVTLTTNIFSVFRAIARRVSTLPEIR